MSAETYSGIQVYSITNPEQLRVHYDGTTESKKMSYAWDFRTLLTSQDFTKSVGQVGISSRCGRNACAAIRIADAPGQGANLCRVQDELREVRKVHHERRFAILGLRGHPPPALRGQARFEDYGPTPRYWKIYGNKYHNMQALRGVAQGSSGPLYNFDKSVAVFTNPMRTS